MGLAIAGLTLVAVLLPTVGSSPAGAATAPLTTEDGVGIRVDENALTGPALEAIEDALQPFVDQMISDGASGPNAPFQGRKALHVSSNVELSLDFLAPGGSRPDGGLKVHADIEDIEIRFVMDPVWPFSDCNIWARPDTGTIDAVGRVDRDELPDAPLTVEPIQATWDDDPSVTSDGVCWTYVAWQAVTNWWNGIWDSGNSESTAARIERELNDVAQDLIDGLWTDHVVPVVDSLESFGITWGQLRTDTHGLIVTADVNASNGLSIPGMPGGPYSVGNTEDAGVTSNVNTVLAARSDVTVTIHPNVVNQFLNALNQGLNSQMGVVSLHGPTVEAFLLPANERGLYYDSGWTLATTVSEPYFTEPTGAGGRPQIQLPEVTFTFSHPDYDWGFSPVATFTGTMSGIDLLTEVRSGTSNWGPAVSPSGASVSLDFHPDSWLTGASTQAHMTATGQTPDDALPFAKQAIDWYNDSLLVPYLSLAPIEVGDIGVNLCTSCSRVSGDQRYTEFFTVG